MRCREIVNGNVVWFGSVGKDEEGNAIFAKSSHTSYVEDKEGTAASLTQRLSVLKGELWYSMSYGLPLLDKMKTKAQMDIAILKIVNEHPDVKLVLNFSSQIINHHYSCAMIIVSKYGDIAFSI